MNVARRHQLKWSKSKWLGFLFQRGNHHCLLQLSFAPFTLYLLSFCFCTGKGKTDKICLRSEELEHLILVQIPDVGGKKLKYLNKEFSSYIFIFIKMYWGKKKLELQTLCHSQHNFSSSWTPLLCTLWFCGRLLTFLRGENSLNCYCY